MEFRCPGAAPPAAVDLRLDLAHLFVGDDEKISRPARRIKNADARHAFAQVEQFGLVLASRFELCAQFDVELVQAPGGAHVDRVVLDLLDGGDVGQRQEEAEVIGEVWIVAGDGFATGQFFGFKGLAVGGEDELGSGLCGGGTLAQRLEGFAHCARCAHGDVDVVALEHAVGHIRCVVVAGTQALESRVLIAKSGEEGERKLRRVEGLFS